MSSPLSYIPLGSLIITQEGSKLTDDEWRKLREKFCHWTCIAPVPLAVNGSSAGSFDEVDDIFLRSGSFKNYRNLLAEKWVRVELRINPNSEKFGVARIYILPDDVDNRLVDRASVKLHKSRKSLISLLDLAPEAWSFKPSRNRLALDCTFEGDAGHDDESLSLLQLFNTIPSPDPAPDTITNLADREAAYSLLDGDLPGLRETSVLYDYQRRSAAVMIQRESQPGRVLDPRLVKGTDQTGGTFYYDLSDGVLLKEPRFYEGVRGGILAEQMGSGKTLICLAVILASRHSGTRTPDLHQGSDIRVRTRIGSLADMAASSATSKAAAWKFYFNVYEPKEMVYSKCIDAINRNPGFYHVPARQPRRLSRRDPLIKPVLRKIWHSHASLVIVPNNLVRQWVQEIEKHTVSLDSPAGLKVLQLTSHNEKIPDPRTLSTYDIVLVTNSRLDRIWRETMMLGCPLSEVHFKRCIVDEGHKLGYAKIANKSNVLLAIDAMSLSARWIVTGTPATGLFGVDDQHFTNVTADTPQTANRAAALAEAEKGDLEKIGAIASLYLNARPWSNSVHETADTPADWAVYVMQPQHSTRSTGRKGVLRATLNSLLIRHRLSQLNTLLPSVNEKIVVLDGSYQDKLSLNIFSMMIIFNAVQSQRVDRDYFFDPHQRKALLQLLHNLKQASFFGGSFFTKDEIKKSLETAQSFVEEKKVPISEEDEVSLKQAMEVAQTAIDNQLKEYSNKFNEVPIFIQDFLPNGVGSAWSLDDRKTNPTCTDAGMVLAVQKLIVSSQNDTTKLNSLLNGKLEEEGRKEKAGQITSVAEVTKADTQPLRNASVLAGNTALGGERVPRHLRPNTLQKPGQLPPEQDLPDDLKKARLVSTVSAKLSYLIDAIVEHQEREKLIIFYENENVAWYLAGILEVIHVRHFIYAKKLSYERKMSYINTFNNDPELRVILMDLTQAAVGLDMKAASRIYFINPVLNPQIQTQAIGRARRISQQKPVTVETLVLRGSIEEVIVERKKSMSQIEHWKCKSILDDRPIYNWIRNASIIPLAKDQNDCLAQTVPLNHPQPIFGSKLGGIDHTGQGPTKSGRGSESANRSLSNGLKRSRSPEPKGNEESAKSDERLTQRVRFTVDNEGKSVERPTHGVRFADE
ncbi:P-loop containing nucleoside triphosphate hydrolase protein [Colletotrichum navitas]|uniref:P-loop containing nucleoside triphosphate hydrolase protein n=1 Tax=Colletotrichum navitas TaxID=681940 RepID=A0AAD8QDQ5_9PEZI|nr:P-loop containing nucleoside triphosphate hydrolase protein [Colletotrichum navitas]KAK1600630.1 P-loop containing nucleoside triphosphate hydrolase protein [Colletotrichum navitas]